MKTIKIQYEDIPKKSNTPILTYCRQLIKNGEDSSVRLEIYRGKEDWDVAISSIGEGAKLGISEDPRIRLVNYDPPTLEYSFNMRGVGH